MAAKASISSTPVLLDSILARDYDLSDGIQSTGKIEATSIASPQEQGSRLSAEAKVGIGLGVTSGVLLGVIIAFAFILLRRRRLASNGAHSQRLLDHDSDFKRHDVAQKNVPNPKTAWGEWFAWTSMALDTWLYEVIGLSFSIACFVALFCVLVVYNNDSVPHLPTGVTLNTVISVLSTASKSSLLFVVGECVGQLRWVSLWDNTHPHALSAVQTYDSASRGPWGSLLMLLMLIKQRTLYSLATIGAFITIISLAFDPFIQEILRYPLRELYVESNEAIIHQSRAFTGNARQIDFMGALNNALWSTDNYLDPICPTGECKWPLFQSLEVCSKCEDVTASATLSGCDFTTFNFSQAIPKFPGHDYQETSCNASVPGLFDSNTTVSLVSYHKGNSSVFERSLVLLKSVSWLGGSQSQYAGQRSSDEVGPTLLGVKGPLFAFANAHFTVDKSSNATEAKTSRTGNGYRISKVTECVLALCTRTYDVSVTGGHGEIKILEENYATDLGGVDRNGKCWGFPPSRLVNETTERYIAFSANGTQESTNGDMYETAAGDNFTNYCSPPTDFSEYLNYISLFGLQNFIFYTDLEDEKGNLNSTWTFQDNDYPWVVSSFGYNEDGDRYETENDAGVRKIHRDGLEETAEGVARSLSRWARDNSSYAVLGEMGKTESYVEVNWPWLALPAALILLGACLLISTALVSTRRSVGLWKSSVLPLLYHGLDQSLIEPDEGYKSISMMEQAANNVKVRLGVTSLEARSMLHADYNLKASATTSSEFTSTEQLQNVGLSQRKTARRRSW